MANRKNYVLKVLKNGKVIDQVRTHSFRTFLPHLRSINWQEGVVKTYLRVSYGKKLSNFNRLENFYNDGWYENQDDLNLALNAFKEEE